MQHQTIYEKLGDERLKLILDTFYDKVFENPVLSPLFNKTEKDSIKHKQFCFLTQFLGGPPRYNEIYGPPRMRARHLPHRIDETAKNEWLKLMKESIQTLDMDEGFKDALYNCFPKLADHMKNTYD